MNQEELDKAHEKADPHGYLIEDIAVDGEFKLQLTRLVDRQVVGVFDSRNELDQFVANDDLTP